MMSTQKQNLSRVNPRLGVLRGLALFSHPAGFFAPAKSNGKKERKKGRKGVRKKDGKKKDRKKEIERKKETIKS